MCCAREHLNLLSSAPYREKPYAVQLDSADSIPISNSILEMGAEILASNSKNHNCGKKPESSSIYATKLINAV